VQIISFGVARQPCRTGARAQSGGSMRAGADRRQLPIVTGFLADFARNADYLLPVGRCWPVLRARRLSIRRRFGRQPVPHAGAV